MAHLIADHITLQFPLHSKAQVQADSDDSGVDDRLITNSRGRIVGIQALRNINFSLNEGDRLGLIGQNGSGKTTLLQVLAEIMVPDAGTLTIEGRSTNLLNINLGMQPGASADRNITLRGLAAGHSLAAIDQCRVEIIDFAQLGEFAHMPVETYSAGMRMRLNYAIATAFQPEILILDEWLSTGDIAFRERATARMKQFVDQAGILILASHSEKLLKDNCNRAIWLDQGRIRADGDVNDLWEAYAAEQKKRVDEDARLRAPEHDPTPANKTAAT
ncbi:MAG: ABC transporter ATP-binding protein [Pseudomonadota bacterium]